MLGVYEIGSERIGEATYTDESFLLGGFMLLWALDLGEQALCSAKVNYFDSRLHDGLPLPTCRRVLGSLFGLDPKSPRMRSAGLVLSALRSFC